MATPRVSHTLEYKDDDGHWCYAWVVSTNDDGSFNLLYKAHTGGSVEGVNDVPADSDRLK